MKMENQTKIEFELVDSQNVNVKIGKKTVGRIFTPAGSGNRYANGIQVCGFDEAFDLWACAIFLDVDGHGKKDIGLLYSKNSYYHNDENAPERKCNFDMGKDGDCFRCFRPKKDCFCKDLTVKKSKDLPIEHIDKETHDGRIRMNNIVVLTKQVKEAVIKDLIKKQKFEEIFELAKKHSFFIVKKELKGEQRNKVVGSTLMLINLQLEQYFRNIMGLNKNKSIASLIKKRKKRRKVNK